MHINTIINTEVQRHVFSNYVKAENTDVLQNASITEVEKEKEKDIFPKEEKIVLYYNYKNNQMTKNVMNVLFEKENESEKKQELPSLSLLAYKKNQIETKNEVFSYYV